MVFKIDLKPVKIHNDLAVARYSLSLSEQKLFIYAIRHLNQNDKNFVESKFRLIDFANYAHLDVKRLYKDIDQMTESLMKTIIRIKTSKDKWTRLNLTRNSEYDNGIISFTFNDDMKKLLLQLQEHYFLQSPSIMNFKSKYSIRMYDFLKSTSYSRNVVEINIEELKEMLDIEGQYERTSNLKQIVIDVAVREINEFSDIKVRYENIFLGRKIVGLKFFVKREVKEGCVFGKSFDLNLFREKIGLSDFYSDSHIEILYETTVENYTGYKDMNDIFNYMKICYEYTKERKPKDEFNYYRHVLEKDYPNASAQISTGYFLEIEKE